MNIKSWLGLGIIAAALSAALPDAHAALGPIVQVLPNGCGTGAPGPGANSLYTDTKGTLCQNAPRTPAGSRPPAATDAATLGYKVGDIWSYASKIWQAQQVSAGAATWVPVNNIGQARPLDLAGTAVGAYGTVQLNSSFAGNDLILTRGSDSTTKPIGFVGGVVDATSADVFCAADFAAGTCYVTTLFDQSGNAFDATAPAGPSAPIWTTNTVNGLRAITFNSVQSGTVVARYMTVPTTASFTNYNTSLYAIAQTRSSAMSGAFAAVGATFFYNGATPLNHVGVVINAGLGSAPIGGQSGPAVTVMAQTAGVASYYQGNSVETGVATGQPASTTTGATLGSSGGSGTMDAVALVLYNRALSATDINNLRVTGELILKAAPQTQDIWVADGDSITNGYGSTFLRGYPRQGLDLLPQGKMLQYNTAIYGTTLATHAPLFSAFISPLYQAGARNFIVSVAICTNDLGAGTTGATCYANLKAYVAQIRALGPNVRVVVATLLPRSGAYSAEATNFNTLLRNGWSSFANALADLAADPVMGLAANSSNTAYYLDALHPTDLGYSYLAPIMTKAVNSLLQ